MNAPPEYCDTYSKFESPPIYVLDVGNLTWNRNFPPTYDDEERQLDEPMRSIERELEEGSIHGFRCGPCLLSETKSFLLCFFTVFLGLLILLPTLFFITVFNTELDPNVSPSM